MRTPGPTDPSLRIVNASADQGAGSRAGLKVGALVFVEVRERLGGELYRVAVGGRLFVASSAFPLEPGSTLRARVERSGEGLALRIAPRDLARDASGARPAELQGEGATRLAAAALLREGIAPDAKSLARVRRALLRDSDSGGEAEALAAKMEAKGIPSEEGALDELLSLLGGRGGGGGGGAGREKREPEREGRSPAEGMELAETGREPAGSSELEADFSLELPEEEFPGRLARLLRAMAMRVGGGSDSLSLFNHLRGPEGHWLIVPFRFDADSVAFKGGLRIQLPYVRGGQGRFEASFEASRGSHAEDWSFFVSFGGGRPPSLRLEPSGSAVGELARSKLDILAKGLVAHACSVRLSERGERKGIPAGDEAGGFDLDA